MSPTSPLASISESDFRDRQRAWRLLSGLRARQLDLSVLRHLPETIDFNDLPGLEALLIRLGLNDEGRAEFPESLHEFLGRGLLIWQFPIQFAAYLAVLAGQRIESYLELGIRHGGSLIATVELLQRAHPLQRVIGVDILPCPAMDRYTRPGLEFWQLSTLDPEFIRRLRDLPEVDLVMIDTHHAAAQCRTELEVLLPHARMIALHDIHNRDCPGIGEVWREFRQRPGYRHMEFNQQYPGQGPYMGIGLAIRDAT